MELNFSLRDMLGGCSHIASEVSNFTKMQIWTNIHQETTFKFSNATFIWILLKTELCQSSPFQVVTGEIYYLLAPLITAWNREYAAIWDKTADFVV